MERMDLPKVNVLVVVDGVFKLLIELAEVFNPKAKLLFFGVSIETDLFSIVELLLITLLGPVRREFPNENTGTFFELKILFKFLLY